MADKTADTKSGPRRKRLLTVLLILSLLLFETAVIGTVAYIFAPSEPVRNYLRPATVSCAVTESFDSAVKSDVSAVNTGDAEAYLRLRLLSYRVNGDGLRIGGTAPVPDFTPGEGWTEHGGCWYYTLPVAPGASPAAPLIGQPGIRLVTYDDADGGRQVLEVMAEAIQSLPADAVGYAWGVSFSGGVLSPWTGE